MYKVKVLDTKDKEEFENDLEKYLNEDYYVAHYNDFRCSYCAVLVHETVEEKKIEFVTNKKENENEKY